MKGILTPQQSKFLQVYCDPNSSTFGNAYKSAIDAKYTERYARNMISQLPEWLSENISRFQMFKKAEKNLNNALDIDIKDKELGERGLKATMFVAERLGRKIYGKEEGEKQVFVPIQVIIKNGNEGGNISSETIPGF